VESSVLDDDRETALLGSILATAKADDDGDELENDSRARMKHYGGSERTVDGGGMYHGGVNGGRKSSLGGAAEAATAPVKRKDSVSSKEIDVESDASKDVDVRDESNDSDSSDADEYVPIVSKKRKSTEGPKQRKAANEFPADAEEEITTARKHPPRRCVTASKMRHTDCPFSRLGLHPRLVSALVSPAGPFKLELPTVIQSRCIAALLP
jgi:hypothetical protein